MWMDCCPVSLLAMNSILMEDECTSSCCEVAKVLSGREDAKFHSSSVAAPFGEEGADAACDDVSARSSREEDAAVGLAAACRRNGELALELAEISAANGSVET